MAETQHSKSERKRERQPISVPFIWEEKPGMPKKDWKPFIQPAKPPAPPAKFVVSVPFGWEAKPGTPLPSFNQPPKESGVVAASREHSDFLLPPPKYSVTGYGGKEEQGDNEAEESSDSELDTCSVETDDSFSSAKSLLANGLISTAAISSAVPVLRTSLAPETTDSGLLQSPGSPASETDSISSYATGTTSLAGASFLEWLFPLLVPNSNAANKGGSNAPSQNADLQAKEFLQHLKIILWMTGLHEEECLRLLHLWSRQRNQSVATEVEETTAAETNVKILPSGENYIPTWKNISQIPVLHLNVHGVML